MVGGRGEYTMRGDFSGALAIGCESLECVPRAVITKTKPPRTATQIMISARLANRRIFSAEGDVMQSSFDYLAAACPVTVRAAHLGAHSPSHRQTVSGAQGPRRCRMPWFEGRTRRETPLGTNSPNQSENM